MKYCKEPFVHADIDLDGDVRLCCDSWHPKVVGNINKNSLEEIWNGNEAQHVRDTIDDQSYKFCKLDVCPVYKSNQLSNKPFKVETNLPKILKFSFDESCNLECPSCRSSRIQHKEGTPNYIKSMNVLNSIKENYYQLGATQPALFIITGSGDPFGSDVFRHFLYELDGRRLPLLEIGFLTNGVMLTEKTIKKIHKIHNNIKYITISIDCSNEDTYNIVRKGGNFKQLVKNIEYIHSCEYLKNVPICYSFVVQERNVREMESFADWILSFDNATIRFTRLLDGFAGSILNFQTENVFDKDHKSNHILLNSIETLKNKHYKDRINFTNILNDYEYYIEN